MRIYNFPKTKGWYFIKYSVVLLILVVTLYTFQNTGRTTITTRKDSLKRKLMNVIERKLNIKEEEDDDREHEHICRRITEYKGIYYLTSKKVTSVYF
jgi:hypothetical protein